MAIPSLAGVAAYDKTSTDKANGVVTGVIAAVGAGKPFSVWGPMNFVLYTTVNLSLQVTKGSNGATIGGAGANVNVGDTVKSSLVPPGTTVLTNSAGTATLAFPTQTWPGQLVAGQPIIRFPNGVPTGLNLNALVGATIAAAGQSYFGSGVTVLSVGADGLSLNLSAAPASVPTTPTPIPIEFALTANCITASGTDNNALFIGSGITMNGTFILERSFDGGPTWIGCNVGGSGTLAKYVNPANPLSITFGDPEMAMLYRINCTAFGSNSGVVINYRFSTTGQAAVSVSVPAIM